MPDIRKAVAWVRAYYDRLLAFAMLIALSGSLLYLAVRVGMIRSMKSKFDDEIAGMRPLHEHAAELDQAPLEAVLARVRTPFELPPLERPLLSPEARVWCTDCRLPIPFDDTICPFCGKEQRKDIREEEYYDGDKDGMWDSWERTNRLDQLNAADATEDPDGDGFTNYEEFMGSPRTDPHNASDFPPVIVKLRLIAIEVDPFKLRFRGMIKRPDGSLKFQINLRGDLQTYFKALGETVEGFTLEKFEEKYNDVEKYQRIMQDDVSELTLRRGDRLIRLVKGQDVQYEEYIAHMRFLLEDREIRVRVNETLELRGRTYRVIDIDAKGNRVVVRDAQDEKEVVIAKQPADGAPASLPSGDPVHNGF